MKKKQREGEGVDYEITVICTTVTRVEVRSPEEKS